MFQNILFALTIGASVLYFSPQAQFMDRNARTLVNDVKVAFLAFDVSVDDFEGGLNWIIEKSPAGLNVNAEIADEAYSGTGAMKITVNPSTRGYAYAQFIKKTPESEAWRGSDGISFWIKGNGTNQSITFSIRAGGYSERYDYKEIKLFDDQWRKIDIPWGQCSETSTGEPLDLKKTKIDDFRFVKIGQWRDRVEMIIDDFKVVDFDSNVNGKVTSTP